MLGAIELMKSMPPEEMKGKRVVIHMPDTIRNYLSAHLSNEWMIQKGLPQRRAHHLVGAIVGEAMKRGVPLSELPLEVLQSHANEIDPSVYQCLGSENAVKMALGWLAAHQMEDGSWRFDHTKSACQGLCQ